MATDETLKKEIWRKLDSLPDEKQHEVLDFVDYLISEYSKRGRPSGYVDPLQRVAEGVRRGLRRTGASASTVSGAMKVFGAANRVASSVKEAGREFMAEATVGSPEPPPRPKRDRHPPEEREIVVDDPIESGPAAGPAGASNGEPEAPDTEPDVEVVPEETAGSDAEAAPSSDPLAAKAAE